MADDAHVTVRECERSRRESEGMLRDEVGSAIHSVHDALAAHRVELHEQRVEDKAEIQASFDRQDARSQTALARWEGITEKCFGAAKNAQTGVTKLEERVDGHKTVLKVIVGIIASIVTALIYGKVTGKF